VRYKLKKRCPADKDFCEVTSQDIIPEQDITKIRNVMPVRYFDDKGIEEDPILLMKLSRNQMLDFTLIAKRGIAKTHAKWSPVATCIMHAEPIVELDQTKINKLNDEHKQELVARCPRKVFSYNNLKKAVDIEDSGACILCQECVKYVANDVDPQNNKLYNQDPDFDWDRMIRIDENLTKFIFTVESTGALTPEDIVLKAFQALRNKLKTLKDLL